MHKFAVITRTRSRPLMLKRAAESVCGQSLKDFVWVIVNDGGEIQAVDEIANQARPRGIPVEVIHRSGSCGMEAASNAGIRASRSEYVCVHDDDDTWEPEFLAATGGFLDAAAEFKGVVTHARRISEVIEGQTIRRLRAEKHKPVLRAIHLADLARSNLFPPIAFAYRRSLYEQLDGYDESMAILGDWDFNLRALVAGDVGLLPRFLANYHVRLDAKEGQAAYANSISPGQTAQIVADAAYRNRMIREDLRTGKPGLGMLLAVARLQRQPNAGSAVSAVAQSWWARIGGRLPRRDASGL